MTTTYVAVAVQGDALAVAVTLPPCATEAEAEAAAQAQCDQLNAALSGETDDYMPHVAEVETA